MIEKLRTWSYYLDKLPLYLKADDNFVEHFRIVFDLLVRLDDVENQLLECFNIMSIDYLDFLNNLILDNEEADILDKIAALYGVTRNFDIDVNGTTKSLTLNNYELLLLIKARIIQYNYDGTYGMSKQFYENVNLPIVLYNAGTPGYAKLFFDISKAEVLSDNILDMFNAGLLTIQSIGIEYTTYAVDSTYMFVWDSQDQDRSWDNGLRI